MLFFHEDAKKLQYHEGCKFAACRRKSIELAIPVDMEESKILSNEKRSNITDSLAKLPEIQQKIVC